MTTRRPIHRPPTARQLDVLRAVVRLHDESGGWPPTVRELGRATGIRSTNGIRDHLEALDRRGLIERREMQTGVKPSAAGRTVAGAPA